MGCISGQYIVSVNEGNLFYIEGFQLTYYEKIIKLDSHYLQTLMK